MLVVIKGPLLSVTGYGCHTRQVWQWARSHEDWEVHAAIVPWGMCTYYINPESEGGIIGDIMEKSQLIPANIKPDLSIQVLLPDEWDPNLAKKNIGITAGIEADKCNPAWIAAAEKMTAVVVPSEYSKLSFLNGGLDPKKIQSIPEAMTCSFNDTDEAKTITEKLDSLSTEFNFLMFGQLTTTSADTDRKNTFNCLKWLCEEFKNDPEVGIVIKTNMGRMTCEDRAHTEKTISSVLEHVREGQYPRVHLIHGLLDPDEIGSLYKHKKIKALCAPTRGEGWGLPILDSSAAGLPIIATGHSGHMDFLKHTRFLDINYKLKEIPQQMVDNRIWVSGARWAEPEEAHFKSRVKKFRVSSDLPQKWADESKQKIQDMFNIESIIQLYNDRLGVIIDNS